MGSIGSTNIGESKQLLAEEVFHHIGRQIIEGALAAGERIRDVDVAEELHVSRTPVREALQRLERLGLVTMYPSRYTEVTAVTPETTAQSLEFAGYQAGIAARLAAPRMTPRQREQVAALAEEMDGALHDAALTSRTRWAVFTELADLCGNAQHRTLIDDVSMALFRNLSGWKVPGEDRERMRQVHADFREAILRGDGDEAERLARAMHYI